MNSSFANNQSHGATATDTAAPIHGEMTRLKANREELHRLLESLEDRLYSVLRPMPPRPVGDETKAMHESPLHGALATEATFVAEASHRIVGLLDRLTV